MDSTQRIIEEMCAEGEGARGVFYENYGSGIMPALTPLSTLLEEVRESHPELVEDIARKLYSCRR